MMGGNCCLGSVWTAPEASAGDKRGKKNLPLFREAPVGDRRAERKILRRMRKVIADSANEGIVRHDSQRFRRVPSPCLSSALPTNVSQRKTKEARQG